MGFFKKQAKLDGLASKSEAEHPRMAAIAEGKAMELEVRTGRPPNGVDLVNRFFHGSPTSWTEEFRDAVSTQPSDEASGDSFKKLLDVLSRVADEAAPAHAYRALEESVTVHLTIAALSQARNILAAHPMLIDVVGDESPIWTHDGAVDAIADMLREKLSACDAALELHGSGIRSRHKDCVLFASMALSVEGDLVARNKDSLRLLIMDADPDDHLWRQMERMKSANGLLATFIEGLDR